MDFPLTTQIDLWFTRLDENLYQPSFLKFLSPDEVRRAEKFRFDLHRKRFIITRAALRSILSLYVKIKPKNIQIQYADRGKPFILSSLQFNLSHSHERAVFAIANQVQVGIDIEKIRSDYKDEVAKRFFSTEEYEAFALLPHSQKVTNFFKIWTQKEALVKATGEGLARLHSLSREVWHIKECFLFTDYTIALATNKIITHLTYWEWTDHDYFPLSPSRSL